MLLTVRSHRDEIVFGEMIVTHDTVWPRRPEFIAKFITISFDGQNPKFP